MRRQSVTMISAPGGVGGGHEVEVDRELKTSGSAFLTSEAKFYCYDTLF